MTKSPSRIRSLLSKIFETLLAKIVVGLIVLAIPLEVLTGYVTDYVWHPIIAVLQWLIAVLQSEVKTWHLLLVIFGVYFFIRMVNRTISQPKPVAPKEPNYYFIERAGYKWKVNRYSGDVYPRPYCRQHQVMMSDYYYRCPVCGDRNTQRLSEYDLGNVRDEVTRIASAQVAGHYKE